VTLIGSDSSDKDLRQVQRKLELVEEVRRTEAPKGADGGLGDHPVPAAPGRQRCGGGLQVGTGA
jgi:hypothetical protein